MRLLGIYRMSKDVVYPYSVLSCPFCEDVVFEVTNPDPILESRSGLIVALEWFVVQSKWSKIDLKNSESVTTFEVKMRLLGLYRMSKYVVYPSSVFSCLFCGDVVFEVTNPDPILEGRSSSL